MSKPMPTTASPAHIMNRTPAVSAVRLASPSVNAEIRLVPAIAVAICTKNKMPTAVAVLLLLELMTSSPLPTATPTALAG
jgi:hypothetical protein